ncbi:hypothetical protein A3I51_03825 [Candidatus Gottesmanbacteria bacterium RIFCSPLOWO2_02_FULL_38_8]|uniref:Mn transporter n=1 Tax=Candidatus Gottesmanbacteria bacterium RIFCSPLOWO2_02_FULL_38_8 TaxID=1798397 RepID=A0A1F6B2B9_9BACT|nr:MAG: hypothetical protein A3I51_03825 [Candidatus Gottesmanbacteria bacterium RIFCSPLOWO2_02_FULL_38_8]
MKEFTAKYRRRILTFMAVFGPATIAAMADNDAAGVATYSLAGAKLGYPVLFLLSIIVILLAITQEMGIRLALVSRKGLADHIRENHGITVAVAVFICLFLANLGTIVTNVAAVKTSSQILNFPPIIAIIAVIVLAFVFVTRGNYRMNQNIMLFVSLFYVSYIISAFMAKPNWLTAITNLIFPHGVDVNIEYLKNYLILGLGVLGTTVTPWGQFFISSFAFDKKIEVEKLKYAQAETYGGALLTNFFTFFMMIAAIATLYIHGIPLESGEQAAMAIRPFAGNSASTVFAIGILSAGFMGMVVVSLTTAYAFSEFFGYSGSLDASYRRSRVFYTLFLIQLVLAGIIAMIPNVSLLSMAILTQGINALILPIVLYFLMSFTNNSKIMGDKVNNNWQKNIATGAIYFISIAAFLALIFNIF